MYRAPSSSCLFRWYTINIHNVPCSPRCESAESLFNDVVLCQLTTDVIKCNLKSLQCGTSYCCKCGEALSGVKCATDLTRKSVGRLWRRSRDLIIGGVNNHSASYDSPPIQTVRTPSHTCRDTSKKPGTCDDISTKPEEATRFHSRHEGNVWNFNNLPLSNPFLVPNPSHRVFKRTARVGP